MRWLRGEDVDPAPQARTRFQEPVERQKAPHDVLGRIDSVAACDHEPVADRVGQIARGLKHGNDGQAECLSLLMTGPGWFSLPKAFGQKALNHC